VVAVDPAWRRRLTRHLDGPASLGAALDAVAAAAGGRHFSWVARTGVAIPAPAVEVTVLEATDPRLPEWVLGHFTGEAWVVLDDDGRVLSTAVLKRYDDRLREISVGTAEEARGRGLAKAVTAAAARAVLAEGRAVLYNHDPENRTSARVAEAVGLHEFGRCHAVVTDQRPGPDAPEDPDSTST
jgi:RimJ/RimL family protein N-acetyltransferase